MARVQVRRQMDVPITKCSMSLGSPPENENGDFVMPAWLLRCSGFRVPSSELGGADVEPSTLNFERLQIWRTGIQIRKDAFGDVHVNLDSSAPCWNDAVERSSLNSPKPALVRFG